MKRKIDYCPCSVRGCLDTKSSRHKVPVKQPEVKKIWLERIGNVTFFDRSDQYLYGNVHICGSHFLDVCKRGKYLHKNSLPTINMPGFTNIDDNIENVFYNATLSRSNEERPSTSGFPLPDVHHISDISVSEEVSGGKRRCGKKANVLMSKTMYHTDEVKKLKRVVKYCKRKCVTLRGNLINMKKRVRLAEKLEASKAFSKIVSGLSPTVQQFIECQIRQSMKQPRGRRFTIDFKLFALALYKCSPKAYRLMQKIFVLPSRRNLSELLKRIPFKPGVNHFLVEHLKKTVNALSQQEKYCCILFDEMAIQPGLHYNKHNDVMEGWVTFGEAPLCKFADHALVFMVQGVYKRWQQPFAFMFTEGSVSKFQLSALIKIVTEKVLECGLKPIATVCDQGASNQGAIKLLIEETQQKYALENKMYNILGFEVDGIEIVQLFDYPHLLKCIRNHLLTKDLLYDYEGRSCRASWDHLLKLYKWDSKSKYFGIFTKLTDSHIVPNKIKKMKVSCATQVFSNSVGNFMKLLIDAESPVIPKAAADTANLLLFFDKLFDSVNGVSKKPSLGHEMRCAISDNSPHFEFFMHAKQVLSSMRFQSVEKKDIRTPPSINNWIKLLSGLMYLWNKLKKCGFKYLIPRNFNQDGLENFFSMIRSHGGRNINPTSSNFTSSFKALTLNNFMSKKSVSSNCEDDNSTGVLDNLRCFILQKETIIPDEPASVVLQFPEETVTDSPSAYAISYIGGYIAKKVFQKTKSCEICVKLLTTTKEEEEHLLIRARRYSAKSLLFPSTRFFVCLNEIHKIISKSIPKYCLCTGIRNIIVTDVLDLISFKNVVCENHSDIANFIVDEITALSLFAWTNKINKILKGVDSRFQPSQIHDPIYKLAYDKYCQRKRK